MASACIRHVRWKTWWRSTNGFGPWMLAPQKAEVNTNTFPQIFYLFLMCEGDVLDVFECWKCQPCQPCQPFSLIRIPLHSPWCRNLRQRTWILGSSFAYVWSLELCGALRSFFGFQLHRFCLHFLNVLKLAGTAGTSKSWSRLWYWWCYWVPATCLPKTAT